MSGNEEEVTIIETEWGYYVSIGEKVYVDRDLLIPVFHDLIARARISGKGNVLVHSKATQRSSSLVQYIEYTDLIKQQSDLTPRIAMVAESLAKTPNKRFCEDVTRNRGVSLKFFESDEEAISWLEKG